MSNNTVIARRHSFLQADEAIQDVLDCFVVVSKQWLLAMTFSVLVLFLCTAVYAQDDGAYLTQALTDESALGGAQVDFIDEGMEGKISLDLRNIDINDALKFLATKARLNIITTKKVSGRITLSVQDVFVKDVFDIMLRSNELAYLKQGEIYNIMSEDEYRGLVGKKFSDMREVRIFRLKYAIPEQAFTLLDTMKSDIGRVLVEPDSGTALVMDTPENIRTIENALMTLDKENIVTVFELKYARAIDVEEQLRSRLDAKKVGTIKADERENLVIVQALPDRMSEIEKLIEALDQKTKSVLIDSRIINVRFIDGTDWQFRWEGLFNVGIKYGLTYFGSTPFAAIQAAGDAFRTRTQVTDALDNNIGSYPFSGTTDDLNSSSQVAPGESMHVGIINRNRDFDLFFRWLQTVGNTQLLSNPRIAVINNQEARIHVGQREAYVTTTTTTGQTTTTVSEEVTFVDVGIQLAVTPTINDDGYIRMKIKPEISAVTDTLITPTGNQIPIIDTSTAETTVLVKDGATIIIGGLRRDVKTVAKSGVPFLSDLPLVGRFFRTSSDGVDTAELMIMITPTIVEGDSLVTGEDDRKKKHESGKDYREYPGFTEDAGFDMPKSEPEKMMKPYRAYDADDKKN
ncbi:MAG: secretin N-terminal domain-containing protein [Candidatus Omnitrophota bacterium]